MCFNFYPMGQCTFQSMSSLLGRLCFSSKQYQTSRNRGAGGCLVVGDTGVHDWNSCLLLPPANSCLTSILDLRNEQEQSVRAGFTPKPGSKIWNRPSFALRFFAKGGSFPPHRGPLTFMVGRAIASSPIRRLSSLRPSPCHFRLVMRPAHFPVVYRAHANPLPSAPEDNSRRPPTCGSVQFRVIPCFVG